MKMDIIEKLKYLNKEVLKENYAACIWIDDAISEITFLRLKLKASEERRLIDLAKQAENFNSMIASDLDIK